MLRQGRACFVAAGSNWGVAFEGGQSVSKKHIEPRLVSFVGQKGGVGKSALARLLAVATARQGQNVLLADFDLEQLTSVEWNTVRLRAGLLPQLDARPFKSLKKLKKAEESFDLIIADTRGLADDLAKEVAEESDVVFMPTGTSGDDLRPTLAFAHALVKQGGEGKITFILSKTGRSESQIRLATKAITSAGFDLLPALWGYRDGFQSEFDAGRAGSEARNIHLRQIATDVELALLARAMGP